MLQQLALARAFLGDPEVLLLDEPTRSLDAEAVARLWTALEARPTTAVLLATHRGETSSGAIAGSTLVRLSRSSLARSRAASC